MMNNMKKLKRLLFGKPRKREALYKVNYHENWLLPPAALFTGTFIVLYAGPVGFGQAVFMPGFYKAAVPSVLAAWFVMWGIVKVAYILDDVHPWAIAWYRGPLVRLALQLFFGIAMPGFFIFGVFALYFLVRGRADLIPRYALEDFPFVLVMLLGYSVVMWIYYRVRMREIMEKFRQWKERYGKTEREMEDRWQRGSLDVVPDPESAKDWLALLEPYRKGNGASWSTRLDGRRDREPYTMKAFHGKCEGRHFFKVRPECIVGRAAIREVDEDGGDVFVILGHGRPGWRIRVSDRRKDAFLAWWNSEPPREG